MQAYRRTPERHGDDDERNEWDQGPPRASVEPDKIVGLDTIVKDAVSLKYTATELTKAQLDDLIQIPPR